jgi:hypothetical protein
MRTGARGGVYLPRWLREACMRVGFYYCATCDTLKDAEAFNLCASKIGGRHSQCKSCLKKVRQTDHGKRLHQIRAVRTTHKGQAPDDYLRKHAENPYGNCACCGDYGKLCLDHDHATNKLRDRLCGPCNKMLGHGKDSATRLQRGAEYLRAHGTVDCHAQTGQLDR